MNSMQCEAGIHDYRGSSRVPEIILRPPMNLDERLYFLIRWSSKASAEFLSRPTPQSAEISPVSLGSSPPSPANCFTRAPVSSRSF